ncbi:cytoplasmic protein [Shewanella sp. A14]
MSLSVNSPSSMPTTIDSGSSLKIAVMAIEQQEVEGQMAVQLIEASQPPAPQPIGNSGHNIDTFA